MTGLAPFHIAFPVDDLDAARHFYGEVLGCPEGRSDPDWIVVRRFEALCAYLAAHPQRFQVRGFADDLKLAADARPGARPRASLGGTLWRHGEQLRRRLLR